MTDAVDPRDVSARPDRRTGIHFPPPIFRPEPQDEVTPAASPASTSTAPTTPSAPSASPTPDSGGNYWAAPAPVAYSGTPVPTAGMPSFMTPRGVASLAPPPPKQRRGTLITAIVVVVVLAAAAGVFGIVELTRHTTSSTKSLTLPNSIAGHPLDASASTAQAKNSIEVLLSNPVKIADFLNTASFGFYGYNVLPDALLAAGPTSKISADEQTFLAAPPTGGGVVVYPPVGTTGVQVWCAPVDPKDKTPGFGCFWTDPKVTCLLFDIDARTNIDAYRNALAIRAELE